MNAKNKVFIYLLIAIALVIQIWPVSAQGETPPDQLTPTQMKNAILVADGSIASRSSVANQPKEKAIIYRFADCDESNPEAPCYFMVTGAGNFFANNSRSITPLASTTGLVCITPIYNSLGTLKAKLQQNVSVTFWGTYGQTPVTLNWGDRAGTGASPMYSWSDLTGPNPNPGWGVYVARTKTAYSTVGGMLTYAPVPGIPQWQQYISNRLAIKSSGWSCS